MNEKRETYIRRIKADKDRKGRGKRERKREVNEE